MGGPNYRCFKFSIDETQYKWNVKIGSRNNNYTNKMDYIIMISGELSNFFFPFFFKNSNILNGIWTLTRYDVQLTFWGELTIYELKKICIFNFVSNT